MILIGEGDDSLLKRLFIRSQGEAAWTEGAARFQRHNLQHTITIAFERTTAREICSKWTANGGKFIDMIPSGSFGVVVVAKGANKYIVAPIPERPADRN